MAGERKVIGRAVAAVLMVVMLIIGFGIGTVLAPVVGGPAGPAGLTGEVQIGTLLPLTGDLASYGENSKVGIEIAAEEVNSFLKASGAAWTLKVVYEDTETKPGPALEKLTSMAAKGIKLVVGPQTSAAVRNVKAYADSNKILLVSQSSTAPELRIGGDYVYRFCPDDTIQGPAIARVMWDRGVRVLINVWRGDAWGDGLERTVSESFKKLGGTVEEGIRYSPEAKEFSSEVKLLSDKVSALIDKHGADVIGIDYIAFAEAVTFFTQARDYDVLWKVKWFGSDGTALLSELLTEPSAAEFTASENVEFINPIFAATKSPKFHSLLDKMKSRLGREPDTYAYAAYDAVWVLALSLMATGKNDADAVIAVLPTVLNNYFGATGWIVLNEGGDKAFSDYDLWAVQFKDGKYEWVNVGTYVSATDSVSWT